MFGSAVGSGNPNNSIGCRSLKEFSDLAEIGLLNYLPIDEFNFLRECHFVVESQSPLPFVFPLALQNGEYLRQLGRMSHRLNQQVDGSHRTQPKSRGRIIVVYPAGRGVRISCGEGSLWFWALFGFGSVNIEKERSMISRTLRQWLCVLMLASVWVEISDAQ